MQIIVDKYTYKRKYCTFTIWITLRIKIQCYFFDNHLCIQMKPLIWKKSDFMKESSASSVMCMENYIQIFITVLRNIY